MSTVQAVADADATEDRVFRALAHPLRRRLLDGLREGPRTTGMLVAEHPDLDRCTVMQHLGVLAGAGLVISVRKGRERWNHLDAGPIQAIHERWIGPMAATQASGLLRLQRAMDERDPAPE
jgi:DNA-binding transcriptional ArsR family regulator